MLLEILETIIANGGDPIRVGGSGRDEILGVESKDHDIEVFGLDANSLCTVLARFGRVSMVDESFGVIKLSTPDTEYDFTLPRRDNKTGWGHRGFQVEVDHSMTPRDAARRRDFTINAPRIPTESRRSSIKRPRSIHLSEYIRSIECSASN